jgi:hypothetical protein
MSNYISINFIYVNCSEEDRTVDKFLAVIFALISFIVASLRLETTFMLARADQRFRH